jgi:hypothetical protein
MGSVRNFYTEVWGGADSYRPIKKGFKLGLNPLRLAVAREHGTIRDCGIFHTLDEWPNYTR